jgi:uncharacterized membrane protein YvbJ
MDNSTLNRLIDYLRNNLELDDEQIVDLISYITD